MRWTLLVATATAVVKNVNEEEASCAGGSSLVQDAQMEGKVTESAIALTVTTHVSR